MDDATKEQLHALVASLDYPMIIVTTAAGDERSGCLVGFHSQCSIDPPRFWVGISKKNHTFGVADQATHLGMHFLGEDELAIASLFGERTGDEIDKFERCAWHEGPGGVPVLDDCPNWTVVRILTKVDGGDHMGFIVEPVAARYAREQHQLSYQQAKKLDAGHEA